MKRIILLFLSFLPVFVTAEELKFVTVLSSPVGTFNKLEAVDPAVPAKSPVINFCTEVGNRGTVMLKGSAKPEMNTVNIEPNAVLGGNGRTYVLRTITMKTGGELKGSRLLANKLNVNYSTAGKSTNLYTNSLTVAGAKTQTLDVNNGDSKITAQHEAAEMVWSNQYQNDKACGSTAECAKQYLLKTVRQNVGKPCTKTKPDSSQPCNDCGRQFRTVNCDTSTGEWQVGEWSACNGGTPSKLTEEQNCTFSKYSYTYHPLSDSPATTITVSPPPTGKRTRTWNASSCSWGSWGPCTADIYVSLGTFTRANNKSYCKSDSVCNTGSSGLHENCGWPQTSGLSGQKCSVPYSGGCYLYQCQRITEK